MSSKQINKLQKIKFVTIRLRILNTHEEELERVAKEYNEANPGENLKMSDIINNLVNDFLKSRITNV